MTSPTPTEPKPRTDAEANRIIAAWMGDKPAYTFGIHGATARYPHYCTDENALKRALRAAAEDRSLWLAYMDIIIEKWTCGPCCDGEVAVDESDLLKWWTQSPATFRAHVLARAISKTKEDGT